jgi:aldehyde dehydrogenase (NAD+)
VNAREILDKLALNVAIGAQIIRSPIDGAEIGRVDWDDPPTVEEKIARAAKAFAVWRNVPAPRRGELVRLLGNQLRINKKWLGALVTLETGKILEEGLGEVQEIIDICDFAVGLSRQLYGFTIPSERPDHRMAETWHPLGAIGVITAFNFPIAVWGWNAALALVCGDPVVWKPSEKTPLTAIALLSLFDRACNGFDEAPTGLAQLALGPAIVGEQMALDPRLPLLSATGSSKMGAAIGPLVAKRFGRCLLELGGNNAMVVAPSADLDLAQRAILFSAVGTAGQRCTSLRRLIVHEDIYDRLLPMLRSLYGRLRIGNPFDAGTLVGPLIDRSAFEAMQDALHLARDQGGIVSGGERLPVPATPLAYYAAPAIVEMPAQTEIVRVETFAPILYVMRYRNFRDALTLQNDVPQGLSSSIFTRDVREAERFLSASGSDCGIANVNIGPSGAEIGGAFGGEKQTGGGRESGSDSWKSYMRRQTTTVNFSDALPLAQGIKFDLE